MTPPSRIALLALAGSLTACSSLYRYDASEIPSILQGAEAELAGEVPEDEQDPADLVKRLRSAREVPGLSSTTREQLQAALELAAGRLILSAEDPDPLVSLVDADLPRKLSVDAGIRGAELLYSEGERMRAFRVIRNVDQKFPQHHLRQEAGELLSRIGQDLAADDRSYALIFKYRSLGIEVLEYFTLEYPSDPRGAAALQSLADIYEERKKYGLAIHAHQDLLLWFSGDPGVVVSEAAIPRLRLAVLGSPQHDRREMQLARDECEQWLASYVGHPLTPQVEFVRTDAIQRLADNDLIVADFYKTVGGMEGAEYHARRALREARDIGNEAQILEAEQLLGEVAGLADSSVTGEGDGSEDS